MVVVVVVCVCVCACVHVWWWVVGALVSRDLVVDASSQHAVQVGQQARVQCHTVTVHTKNARPGVQQYGTCPHGIAKGRCSAIHERWPIRFCLLVSTSMHPQGAYV